MHCGISPSPYRNKNHPGHRKATACVARRWFAPKSPDLRRACNRLHGLWRYTLVFLHLWVDFQGAWRGPAPTQRSDAASCVSQGARPPRMATHGARPPAGADVYTWRTELLLLATVPPTAFQVGSRRAEPRRAVRLSEINTSRWMNQRAKPRAPLLQKTPPARWGA